MKAFYRDRILEMRKEGKSLKTIANTLGCSQSTVSYHINGGVRERAIEKAKVKPHRQAKKDYVLRYMMDNGCEECGERHPACLEFDHIDQSTKRDTVTRMLHTNYSLDTVKEEMAKCRLLCSNCHRKRTMVQLDWYSKSALLSEIKAMGV